MGKLVGVVGAHLRSPLTRNNFSSEAMPKLVHRLRQVDFFASAHRSALGQKSRRINLATVSEIGKQFRLTTRRSAAQSER